MSFAELGVREKQIKLTVISAHGLTKRNLFRLPDPFAVITVDGSRTSVRTAFIKKTLNPNWSESFDLSVKDSSVIAIQIFDERDLRGPTQGFLGVVNLRAGDIFQLFDLGQAYETVAFDLQQGSPNNPTVQGRLVICLSNIVEQPEREPEPEPEPATALGDEIKRYLLDVELDERGDPLSVDWERRVDPLGNNFYVDCSTRTTWFKPANRLRLRLPETDRADNASDSRASVAVENIRPPQGSTESDNTILAPVNDDDGDTTEQTASLDHEKIVELRLTSELPSNGGRETTIRQLVSRLNQLFREDEKWHTRLSVRCDSAQWLVDLLQDLLDDDASILTADRRRLFKALIRLSDYSQLYPRCFTLADLEQERMVAGGSFSDVYTGYLHGQRVAVKMMRVFDESDIEAILKCFGREAVIWRQLSHPHLLPFLGLYKFRGRLCLVSPWMENGHVRAFLKKHSCDTERLLSLVLDVTLGLEHLHAQNIVHGDLKGDNIFITSSLRACIADFGLSSFTTSASSVQFAHSSMPSRGGTARYQAPEVLRGGQNGRRTDIYSWACVVYELFTGMLPFPEMSSDIAVVMAVLAGQRPSRLPSLSGTDALDGLWALLQQCWDATPENRPTAAQIVERMKGDGIGASEAAHSENDWDPASTSRFRHRLLSEQPLPTVDEFERMVCGTASSTSAEH